MKKFSSITKGSLREASDRRRVVRAMWIGACMLAVLFLLPKVLGFGASLVLSPILSIHTYFSESSATIPAYFRDRNDLLDTQRDLERKIAEKSGSDVTIGQLLKENTELRSLLGATNTPRIAGNVVGRPPVMPYDVLVIDTGSSSGVLKNAPVFIGRNQVIGHITEVFSEISIVTLVTTPSLESTVYIYGPNIYTTAIGMGGSILRVNVPQGIVLTEGDLVVIPSLHTGIYGSIVAIDSVPTKPEQYGFVTIDIPLQSIRFVSVGTKPLKVLSFEEVKEIVADVRTDILEVSVPSGVLVDTGTTTSSSTEGQLNIPE